MWSYKVNVFTQIEYKLHSKHYQRTQRGAWWSAGRASLGPGWSFRLETWDTQSARTDPRTVLENWA